jgi:hypothetical protein
MTLSFIGIFAFWGTLVALMTVWTDRTLDFWMTYAKGAPVDVPYWISFIMTIVLNGAMMLVNILTELFRLVL